MTAIERARKVARVALHQLERAGAFSDLWLRRGALALSGKADVEREALHWSARADKVLTWQDHPVINEHINTRVSGDPAVNWLDMFARDFGGHGFECALNLGCGFGDLEAHAFSRGLIQRFTSIDVSGKAIAEAKERLCGHDVDFRREDINRLRSEPETYDVIFAAASLHHFTELELVLDRVRGNLKPGGFFVFDEYVGPSRFQWRHEQLRIINELLAALQPRHRRDLRSGRGRRKKRVFMPPLDETSRDSPFEAVRSEEILDMVEERFEIVIKKNYGGAILHPLLDGIAGNFGESDEDVSLLGRLAGLERELERAGVIGSDFTVVVARVGAPSSVSAS